MKSSALIASAALVVLSFASAASAKTHNARNTVRPEAYQSYYSGAERPAPAADPYAASKFEATRSNAPAYDPYVPGRFERSRF